MFKVKSKNKNNPSLKISHQNPANFLMLMILLTSISLGCSYFGKKIEKVGEIKPLTLSEVKNSRDLVSVMKTHDRVKDYVLTRAVNEEQPLKIDGETAEVQTEYWSGLNTVNMTVMKFASAEKATQYFDGEESTQKSNGRTPARGKKPNGDPTLFFGDGKGTMNFITCKKDVCYRFTKKTTDEVVKEMIASADFFSDYDEKYLSAKN